MINFENKKVAVLGLGVEGVSSARFLIKNGAKVSILDKKQKEDIDQEILSQAEKLNVEFIFGQKYLQTLSLFDVIVKSPGVKRDLKELVDAQKKGVIVTSLTKIFFDLCPTPIIGITGTKGKGTTASLIYEMLKASGRDVYLGGNIGTAPLDFLGCLTKQSIVVLELSSFQLQDLDKSPHIAVMLMVTSEHLEDFGDRNHHKSLEEYVEAKRNILRFQDKDDFAVINRDYPASNESDIFTDGKVFYVTRERESVEQGAFIKENAIWISMQDAQWKIIDTKDILLPGKHNWENAVAAAMAATLGGADKNAIIQVLKTFKGLSHRLELAREINGVRYYDDSFSTIPETTIAAIEAFENPEILILGGSSKNSDFAELGKVIGNAKNIKAIIGIGKEWKRIKTQFRIPSNSAGRQSSKFIIIEGAKDMKTIVAAASKIALPGDVVLLSPACASFDMFKNYKDRGEQFESEVSKLK